MAENGETNGRLDGNDDTQRPNGNSEMSIGGVRAAMVAARQRVLDKMNNGADTVGAGPVQDEAFPDVHNAASSRQCWICFATDDDDTTLMWIQPCNCKGTTKWVHQGCLQQWVDEKQKENRDRKVACPQCRTEYLIFFPKAHKLVILLDKIDALVYKICPFMAAGIVIGSLYWTAVTYGAITVMQVAGPSEAMQVMDRMEPTVLLTLLPVIPVGLIFLKMVHWEDSLLLFLRKASRNVPVLNHILPSPVMNESGAVTEMPVSDGMSCTRVFTGALVLPTIATLVGNMFFQSVSSPFQRALLGGLTFIAAKGVIKMYHKQQTYKRLSRRRILDYTEENKKRVEDNPPPVLSSAGAGGSPLVHADHVAPPN
ncbi:e3 ubiquitin-protein ligase [Nesidiocoris tenuis]|uniref:E3 ubiquitin-protein ligase MARCHF5 n=1 Tax=Nesidiocoris tenuis TaxID=355587 RepID=A0ABN7AVL0_9HEMI|nr:e3 ubiquitin-protein ligase [Nesidiocoris tenuis]